jgi:hypothetical protein
MRTLIAATAAFMLSAFAASAANAQWVGYSVNDYGFGKAYANSEEAAWLAAAVACENATGRDCEEYNQNRTISVRYESWFIVAVKCGGQRAVGGSKYGVNEAIAVAAGKIGRSPRSCRLIDSE